MNDLAGFVIDDDLGELPVLRRVDRELELAVLHLELRRDGFSFAFAASESLAPIPPPEFEQAAESQCLVVVIQLLYRTITVASEATQTRWLLLIHQIPAKPNYLRIKIGRRLQSLGAVAIKNSVYVLPRSDQAHEDFEWVAREIAKAGGDASVCEARFIEGLSDEQIEVLFSGAREADYLEIAKKARELFGSGKRSKKIDEERRGELESGVARLRKRLSDVSAIDFFGANGSQAAEAILTEIEECLRRPVAESPRDEAPAVVPRDVHGRTWVTRKGVHVDRMASAWLIRRFIDPEARFKFVPGKGYQPEPSDLRFDMFEAEFTHDGDRCTFEVLLRDFELNDASLKALSEIVHEIDLKDSKFGRPDTLGLERLINGICMATKDDESRLTQGQTIFDGLYEYFKKKRT